MNKRAIITGASGPLGIVLIKECIKAGIEVLAVVRPDSEKKKDIPEHSLIQIAELDISQIEQLPVQGYGKFDLCFHLAWTHTGDKGRDDPLLQSQNIQNTLKTAWSAKEMGCQVFIGAGSQAEYGIVNKKADESTPTNPQTWYGRTKLAAGQLVLEYCKQLDMRCNWVRIFAVYGPYENEYILTSYVIRTLLRGEKPILTPCEQEWDYLYCEDAARALLQIGERASESGVYCLGSGRALRLKECLSAIRDMINPELPLGIGQKNYGEKQIMHLEADIAKLQKDVGFQPQISFEEGINKTIQWYIHKQA